MAEFRYSSLARFPEVHSLTRAHRIKCFVASILLVAAGCSGSQAGDVSVIDGDTIRISAVTYRLYGIDAPEVGQRCNLPDGGQWDCGARAMDQLRSVVSDGDVACESRGLDASGVTLAVCRAGGLDLGRLLVKEGLAWALRGDSTDYVDAEDRARAAKVGVWAAPTDAPWEYRSKRSWASGTESAPRGAVYRPVPVEIGKALVPPPELVATAAQLRAAAAAGNSEAVFALLNSKVRVVVSGLTPSVRRKVETAGPWRDAPAALAEIGVYFTEGEPQSTEPAAARAGYIAQALDVIAQATERPEWGRDPLIKGATCTYRGAQWDAKAAAKIDDGARGLHVPAPTPTYASASSGALRLGTLQPGKIYFEEHSGHLPEGWRGVRLPSGEIGAVREDAVRELAVWGLCFVPDPKGGWKIGAFSTALL